MSERHAELLARLDATDRKLDGLSRSFLILARYLVQRETIDMSATTDAIKAKLTTLEADVDAAAEHAAGTAKDALAAEEADLVEIEQRLDAIGAKVHAMASSVATTVAPAAGTATDEHA